MSNEVKDWKIVLNREWHCLAQFSNRVKLEIVLGNKSCFLKVWYFQNNIGIIYRLKQIFRCTTLNLSFKFSRVFCKLLTAKTLTQLTPSYWEEQFFKMSFQKFKFKIVIYDISLRPINFFEKKWLLGLTILEIPQPNWYYSA